MAAVRGRYKRTRHILGGPLSEVEVQTLQEMSRHHMASGRCSYARLMGFCRVKPHRLGYLPTVRTPKHKPHSRLMS